MPLNTLLFVTALSAAYAVPGPDMLLVLETGARRDRQAVAATLAGLAVARAAHVTLAAMGLTALVQAVPEAFTALRWIGAGWLVWLGWRILAGAAAARLGPDAMGTAPPPQPFRRALLTNLLNPKALLFCSILLPQFVSPDPPSPAAGFLWLGAVLVAVGLLFDAAYAALGTRIGRLTASRPGLALVQQRCAGGILIGFGVHLAVAW